MQRKDAQRADRLDTGAPAAPARPAAVLANADCVIMFEALRQRVAGLVAPLTNGHAATTPQDYTPFARRIALTECDAALGQLLALVNTQQEGAAQIVLGVSELRVLLSGAQERR